MRHIKRRWDLPTAPTIPFRIRKISHLHVFPLGRQNSLLLPAIKTLREPHWMVITVQTWLPLPINPQRLGLSASKKLTRLTVRWFNDVYLRIKILWDYSSEKNTDATVVRAVQQKWKMHGSAALLVLCEILIPETCSSQLNTIQSYCHGSPPSSSQKSLLEEVTRWSSLP